MTSFLIRAAFKALMTLKNSWKTSLSFPPKVKSFPNQLFVPFSRRSTIVLSPMKSTSTNAVKSSLPETSESCMQTPANSRSVEPLHQSSVAHTPGSTHHSCLKVSRSRICPASPTPTSTCARHLWHTISTVPRSLWLSIWSAA